MEQMKDISARLKAVRGDKTQTAEGDGAKSYNYEESYRLRARMVGVLLRDARVAAMRTVDDCARLVRVDAATVEAWEYGDAIPSLPQLELLAFYLDVPVSHFWGLETLEANRRTPVDAQEEYLNLRNRMIGALLRAAREESNLTLDAVAETTHLSAEYLQAYEFGELPIPMHELSVIAGGAQQCAELLATRENWKHFNDLPDDLRAFAANPLNIGFIEIALAFSEMPSEKLKRIAVSMLDITGY
jgi:transcriptional regulator with XRE-family HTH domain